MTAADLKKYKDSCYSALSRDLTEFEKNFLLIAGGILAFSTTFIKDVVKISSIQDLPILFLAWAFIIFSIALMMYAFLKSASSSDKLLKTVDEFEIKNCLFQDSIQLNEEQWKEIRIKVSSILKNSKSSLKRQRNGAVICFLLGIVFLSSFVSINLVKEQKGNLIQQRQIKNNKLNTYEQVNATRAKHTAKAEYTAETKYTTETDCTVETANSQ